MITIETGSPSLFLFLDTHLTDSRQCSYYDADYTDDSRYCRPRKMFASFLVIVFEPFTFFWSLVVSGDCGVLYYVR